MSSRSAGARVPLGSVGLRLPLYRPPSEEIRSVVTPPYPAWLRDLYGSVEVSDPGTDMEAAEISVAAALSAVSSALHHRLEQLAWLTAGLEEAGWTVSFDGESVLATTVATPEGARARLDELGLAAAVTLLCEPAEGGWPRILHHGETGL
ncbi:MAG: hypothetical protein M3010_09760 [Candidatus Dormibacteraeota bacterium]|nr:hypothetical protein [Candidatus Dormibacteraeota bacterium]